MTGQIAAGRVGTADNVVGVEVTIDGMLVIATIGYWLICHASAETIRKKDLQGIVTELGAA